MDWKLRVIKEYGNGKRQFDPDDKERLIDACLQPGVSLAGLALEHGVNANQLRNWVTRRRNKDEKAQGQRDGSAEQVFIPVELGTSVMAPPPRPERQVSRRGVEAAGAARQRSSRVRLKVALPNGVRLELEGGDGRLVSAMIEALGRCDVPSGS